MTDERPAEPDTKAVRQQLQVGPSTPPCSHAWTAPCEHDLAAVEAAARLCAIEYAESRVRAYWPCAVYGACRHCSELAALARLKSGLRDELPDGTYGGCAVND